MSGFFKKIFLQFHGNKWNFSFERFKAVHNEVFDHLEHERSSLKHVKTKLSRRNILGHWAIFGGREGQGKEFLEGSYWFVKFGFS